MADYVELDVLKATLEMAGETYADDDMRLAITSASAAVNNACGRSFGLSDEEVRLYVPRRWAMFEIDDLVSLTSIEGTNGTSAFTVWATTDYQLLPLNAEVDGEPWTSVELTPASTVSEFCYEDRPQVRINGTFGWLAVPDAIKEATSILAARLLKRVREAPFGIAGIGADGFGVRVSRTDPDVAMLLAPYVRPIRLA